MIFNRTNLTTKCYYYQYLFFSFTTVERIKCFGGFVLKVIFTQMLSRVIANWPKPSRQELNSIFKCHCKPSKQMPTKDISFPCAASHSKQSTPSEFSWDAPCSYGFRVNQDQRFDDFFPDCY